MTPIVYKVRALIKGGQEARLDPLILQAPEEIRVRELQVGKKVLVTTLLSTDEATKIELKQLYKLRWHVELDLRNIKTTLGMEVFSCKSPDMIEKE